MRKLIKLFNLPPPPPPAKNYAEKSLLSKVGLRLSATWTLLFTSLSLHPWPLFITPRGVHRIRELWLFTNNPWGQYEFSCVGIQSPLSLLMENPYSTSLRYNIVVASVILILERERERVDCIKQLNPSTVNCILQAGGSGQNELLFPKNVLVE